MPHTAVALSKQAEGNSPGSWWAGLSSRCRFQAELCMQQQRIAKALESAGVTPLCRRYTAAMALTPRCDATKAFVFWLLPTEYAFVTVVVFCLILSAKL